jgi:hypothetical protein
MTVKMCIKQQPFAAPIGISRSFRQPDNVDQKLNYLRALKKTNFKKNMPKKPQVINSIANLRESHYGLRAASERTTSKKDRHFDFEYNVDKLKSAPKVEVKNAGDNFVFVCDDQDQEEEKEGGIAETQSARKDPEKQSNANISPGNVLGTQGHHHHHHHNNHQELSTKTTEGHLTHSNKDGGSGKASAGTMAFVTILLHTLSCNFSCQETSCRKMGMVLKHYRSCLQKRRSDTIARTTEKQNGEDANNAPLQCGLCQQFAKIVAQHSMYLCELPPNQTGCPVPMCDAMRRLQESRKKLTSVAMET